MERKDQVSSEEIFKGMQLAIKKMFEKARKNDEMVVFMQDGKVVEVLARGLTLVE